MFRYVNLINPRLSKRHAFKPTRPRPEPPHADITAWCEAEIGMSPDLWRRGASGVYFVKGDNHALAFRMRWC